MRILHIYDSNNADAANYVAMLIGANASGRLNSAPSQLSEALAPNCIYRQATTAEAARQLCEEFRPHLIHQHGPVRFVAVSQQPHQRALPRLIISPHGTIDINFKSAYAIIARSHLEATRLKDRHPRIEAVRNPLVTRTTTPSDCLNQTAAVYRKVLDSDPLPLLSPDARHLLTMALKAAICGDSRWVDCEHLDTEAISDEDFRHLYIYAGQEGVLPLLEKGFQIIASASGRFSKLSCSEALAPASNAFYLPNGYKVPQPMTDKSLNGLLTDIKKNGPSLLRLTEITEQLHNPSLDEAELTRTLKEAHLLSLLASLLPILAEQLLLTEGFMPCSPTDGATTARLRKSLASRLCPT